MTARRTRSSTCAVPREAAAPTATSFRVTTLAMTRAASPRSHSSTTASVRKRMTGSKSSAISYLPAEVDKMRVMTKAKRVRSGAARAMTARSTKASHLYNTPKTARPAAARCL